MKAETMMKEYKSMKLEQKVLEMQLSRFEGMTEDDVISMMTFSHRDDEERVQTSTLSDKTAKSAINYRKVMTGENDEWYDFLIKKYAKLSEELSFFEDCVSRLSGDLPGIITDMLTEGVTWEEIAAKHHISRRTVGNYRRAAIKEIDAMYALRESCACEYMLS